MAIGCATFATGMIFREPPARSFFVHIPAFDPVDDHSPTDSRPETGRHDDDRIGSIHVRGVDAGGAIMQPERQFDAVGHEGIYPLGEAVPGYVLRYADVDAALVQGPGGIFVVRPGTVIPEAGLVRSIERRAGRWVVVTATGMIEEPAM
jgi:hypothetical protein